MSTPLSLRHFVLAVLLLCGAAQRAAAAEPAVNDDSEPRTVRVERVKPHRARLETLRFLKTNRDFVRGRLDLIREEPVESKGGALEMDPRFLAYRDLLAAVRAAGDSVGAAADAGARRELFASITELGQLEAQLDRLGILLADQRARLAVLQEDFSGHQRTALAIVAQGAPAGAGPSSVTLTRDDGVSVTVALSAEERSALAGGGTLELFHGLIEPREQVIEIALGGDLWANAPHGYVTLAPERDQLTFLRLELAAASPETGAAAIGATTWRHAGSEAMGALVRP